MLTIHKAFQPHKHNMFLWKASSVSNNIQLSSNDATNLIFYNWYASIFCHSNYNRRKNNYKNNTKDSSNTYWHNEVVNVLCVEVNMTSNQGPGGTYKDLLCTVNKHWQVNFALISSLPWKKHCLTLGHTTVLAWSWSLMGISYYSTNDMQRLKITFTQVQHSCHPYNFVDFESSVCRILAFLAREVNFIRAMTDNSLSCKWSTFHVVLTKCQFRLSVLFSLVTACI